MSKLEELSELLVHELDQFSASIEKLEKLNKDGLKIDLSDLKGQFREHRLKTEKIQERMLLKMESVEHALEYSKVFPNWALAIVISSIIINFFFLIFIE